VSESAAQTPDDMNLPGWRLHPLHGAADEVLRAS
jgi:hypothetical protein